MNTPQRDNCRDGQGKTAANGFSVPHDGAITPSINRIGVIIEEEQRKYASLLGQASPDMNSFVDPFVARLFQGIAQLIDSRTLKDAPNLEDAVRSAIVKAGSQLYYRVGRETLGPLVVRFAEHVLSNAPIGSTIAFLARDAEPYFEAAKVISNLTDISSKNLILRYVTLNRQHFRIFDENLLKEQLGDLDGIQEYLKVHYLKQEGFDNPCGVVIVDTGCWGTLIEKLWKAKAIAGDDVLNLQEAYFMYSHNPHIYGFVNQVAVAGGRSDLATGGVFIGDTFECLPKTEESSSQFVTNEDGTISPVRVPIDSAYLSAWHTAVLKGIKDAASTFVKAPSDFPSAHYALQIMEEGHRNAQRNFTGVLPQSTPKWSQGDEYLKNWSLSRIPPRA